MPAPPPDAADFPRVTPYLLRDAGQRCPRRLARDATGASGSEDPVTRARLRHAVLDAVAGVPAANASLDGLTPEEGHVVRQATHWYGVLYGSRPLQPMAEDRFARPSVLPRRRVRLGGWVDVLGETPEGILELRQLELWGGPAPTGPDPLEHLGVLGAVLRVAMVWGADRPLRACWSDLVRGDHRERVVELPGELDALGRRLDALLVPVHAAIADPRPLPGADCSICRHVRSCPALRDDGAPTHDAPPADNENEGVARDRVWRRGDLMPAILRFSPSSLEAWHRCPRAWRNRHVLALPASDERPTPEHGLRLHAVLCFVHEHGSCHDRAFVADVLDAHDADARLRDEVARHERRCPSPATAVGHELAVARFQGRPGPPFLATARLDAVWDHDGILDIRDFKTGGVATERLRDDPRARVQAWVAAPLAHRRGLRVRVRYEHLAAEVPDDPEPWAPDDDELDAVATELHELALSLRARGELVGVAEPRICSWCAYRSICPESAVPGVPVWPRVEADEPAGDGLPVEGP